SILNRIKCRLFVVLKNWLSPSEKTRSDQEIGANWLCVDVTAGITIGLPTTKSVTRNLSQGAEKSKKI
ncbi:MAG: hypothetical protein ACRD6X_15230, partial [Pyrinomonadaceae bacterium]